VLYAVVHEGLGSFTKNYMTDYLVKQNYLKSYIDINTYFLPNDPMSTSTVFLGNFYNSMSMDTLFN